MKQAGVLSGQTSLVFGQNWTSQLSTFARGVARVWLYEAFRDEGMMSCYLPDNIYRHSGWRWGVGIAWLFAECGWLMPNPAGNGCLARANYPQQRRVWLPRSGCLPCQLMTWPTRLLRRPCLTLTLIVMNRALTEIGIIRRVDVLDRVQTRWSRNCRRRALSRGVRFSEFCNNICYEFYHRYFGRTGRIVGRSEADCCSRSSYSIAILRSHSCGWEVYRKSRCLR